MILIYAVAGGPVMKAAFGEKFADSAAPLPWLGVAFTLLACTYLAVQYHLALHRWRFIGLLAVAAVAQPIVVTTVGPDLLPIARGLTVVNGVLAVVMVLAAYRVAAHPEEVVLDPEEAGEPVGTSETLA
jgi:hypothetical protein